MNKKSSHNIWAELRKPFFVLAPLDDVSDTVFRQVVAQAAKPDMFFTEFTNVDGYFSPGQESVARKLRWDSKVEQPLIAQIWGKNPDNYYKMAGELTAMGFAGIDINMGCPERSVVAGGNGAGMIGQYDRAGEIIKAVQQGSAGRLPVSVKTRIGINKIMTEEWAEFLLGHSLAALTIHGRTAKEMSKVPAHWDEIAKVAALRNRLGVDTVIVGNGDVLSRAQGEELAAKWGVDGIMIGRGVFHNIFVFEQSSSPARHSSAELITILRYHLDLHQKTWGNAKRFEPLKKFFKIYISGFANASDFRAELMGCKDYAEAHVVIDRWEPKLQ